MWVSLACSHSRTKTVSEKFNVGLSLFFVHLYLIAVICLTDVVIMLTFDLFKSRCSNVPWCSRSYLAQFLISLQTKRPSDIQI